MWRKGAQDGRLGLEGGGLGGLVQTRRHLREGVELQQDVAAEIGGGERAGVAQGALVGVAEARCVLDPGLVGMGPEVDALGELVVGVEPGLIASQGLVGVLKQRLGQCSIGLVSGAAHLADEISH
ncbi:MAG: hypothetical protein VBE63_03845 [Lamprobacter sp.]|nr:hypothetical protein [Lamprobacter sp.]MEA3639057.1 hypothetical protein [Lamprobacter sp.]